MASVSQHCELQLLFMFLQVKHVCVCVCISIYFYLMTLTACVKKVTVLFAWSAAILSGCCTCKTLMNGLRHSQDHRKHLDISRKNQDEADVG